MGILEKIYRIRKLEVKLRRIKRAHSVASAIGMGCMLSVFLMLLLGATTDDDGTKYAVITILSVIILMCIVCVLDNLMGSQRNAYDTLMEFKRELPRQTKETEATQLSQVSGLTNLEQALRKDLTESAIICDSTGCPLSIGDNPRDAMSHPNVKPERDYYILTSSAALSEEPFSLDEMDEFVKDQHCRMLLKVTPHYTYRLEKPPSIDVDIEECEELIGLYRDLPEKRGRRKYLVKAITSVASQCSLDFYIKECQQS